MSGSITELILEWQALGEEECFTHLATAVRPLIEKTATSWFKRYGACKGSHVDEIVSYVFDHLRRLHPRSIKEPPVAPFRPEPDGNDAAGARYVRWLARRRTQDLLRRERRRIRKLPTLTEAGVIGSGIAAVAQRSVDTQRHEQADSLRRAVASLALANRTVVEGLLQGQSQSQIAATLGVSEGTISRRKVKAVQHLRSMLCAVQPQHESRGESPSATEEQSVALQMTPSLPFVTLQYRTISDRPIAIQRNHRWCAFGCVVSGENDLTWIRRGRQQQSLQKPGVCNFLSPEDSQDEFLWKPITKTTYHTVLVPPEYFEEVAESEGVSGLHNMRPVFGFRDPAIETTILAMGQHRHDGDDLALECNGRSLVLRMLEKFGCVRAGWLHDESVFAEKEARRVCDYVDAHLHDRITLRHLAQVLGLSPGHFNRKCHRSFGVTPSRLVSIRRIQRVMDLLRSTEEPIEQIARSAGFCTPSHCTNTFRAILGIPPSRFRAELLCRY